ncbi:histidine kinase [Paenibacillus oenotherae]|uniref:Histidine kinase n=1 Tax=Paenibacillus oenotherae TaxID=1435645 RepID=A0ABS7D4F4_9BACL|nr:sensor histidine kinase [Paenibacillus oenotherae]MBW7474686.1 histidine kinase [Paenibacillus oenotherae]
MFRTSIRNKLIALLLAATIIPIMTSIAISYFYTKSTVSEESIQENLDLIQLGTDNIENYLTVIEQTSKSVYRSMNEPESLFGIIEREVNKNAERQDFSSIYKTSIYGHLLNMYQSMRDISQIHLHTLANDQSYLIARGRFRDPDTIPYTPPYPPGADKLRPFLEATHESHTFGVPWNVYLPSTNVFTLHLPIVAAPSTKVLGYLSIDVKANELFKISKQLYRNDEENLYIIDKQGIVVFAQNPELLGKPLEENWVPSVLDSSSGNGYLEWNTKDKNNFTGIIFYDQIKSNYSEWTIVKMQPYSYLHRSANQITQINAIIAAIFLVIVVAATLYISYHFTNPIKKLISSMNQIQSGNLKVDIEVKGNDEFSILARRFDSMMQTITDLIMREYKLEIANKTNQMKAMQAQINPHFLNNALQSIGTLALHHQAPKVYSLISSLAKMMRYGMNTNEAIVPLSEEISHVKAYMELQKQRFGNKLMVSFDIEEGTLGIQVPKIILQPLVENVFKHSFEPLGEVGEILILSKWSAEHELVIIVQDDGLGMEAGRLGELQQKLDKPSSQMMPDGQDNIGLSNVLLRLRLHFSEDVRMIVANQQPRGFSVTLHIPYPIGGQEHT